MTSQNIDSSPCDTLNKKNQDILSDYELKGIIGKGTFSVVKLGENKLTKEKVAIKIMLKSKIVNQEDLIRIAREIEMLKKLNHPNVIKIFKILEDSKKFYIIMEYCQNGELFNRIVERQRLTEDEAALFYYQIISGLEYIHKKKIVHRDLKPENLLLSKDDVLKIIDFGLSNYSSFNIMLATPCGSPCYASPEMVSGKKYNGFLIDIWSTGIILFAMICGYLPFEDSNNEVLFGKILRCKINYPKHIGELPLDLMKKIIVPEPTKRITLEQIKKHPFFLKGKLLFSQKFPDLINDNNNNNEILFRNTNPINKINNIMINKERNEKKENNVKKMIDNNYLINTENINNMNFSYQPYLTENLEYNIMNENNYKNKILSINAKTIDFNFNNTINNNSNNIREKIVGIKERIIIDKDKEKEQENIDINVQKDNNNDINNLKEPSSILNPDEIPMDSVPKDYNNERENLEVKDNTKNKKKILSDIEVNKKIKENINEFNKHLTQRLSNIDNYYNTVTIDNHSNHKKPKNQSLKAKKKKLKIINDDVKQVSDNLTKRPRNNIKIPVNNIKKEKKNNSKIKEKIIIEYNPDNKSNSNTNTNDFSTTFNSILDYRYADVNDSKSKYSSKAQELSKTSVVNNKTIPIYQADKNIILINDAKVSHLNNSAPKNNEKIINNYYSENKYPHNNHTNKINKTCVKKIANISKYNIDNIDSNNKENRNNENYMNINHIYKTTNNIMNNTINTENSIKVDVNNNTINGTVYNKKNLYDLFNDLQLIQNNQKKVNNQNNNDYFNNFNVNNIIKNGETISVNYSVEKKKTKMPMNNAKVFKTDKKNAIDLNKYINSFNYNKKTTNKTNINSDREYTTKNNTNFVNSKKIIVNNNDNKNDNNNISLKNNLNSNNINDIYIRENTPSNDLRRTYNDKYFDSITINNNNSINFHEPKLYIYVENNNNNSNIIKNDDIKTYTSDNIGNNKSKSIFKYEKNK